MKSTSEQMGAGALTQQGFHVPLTREFLTVLLSTASLIVLCRLFAPSSIAYGTLAGSLPFAAILIIVGLGQMLVVQQGGFDLSVAGGVSLAVVISTHVPAGDSAKLLPAVLLAACCALATGIVNGVLVGFVRLNAIVATIGMNELIYGGVFAVSGAFQERQPPCWRRSPAETFGASGTPCTLPSRSCSW
jgi:ribose transport system permease protein